MKLLVDGGADVVLDVIGDGPQRQNLEAQAREDGLSKRVTFYGSLGENQIIEMMQSAEIFILSSLFEALGVVCMEAMSMEVAMVATNVGGVGEIITHDKNGVLVPSKDPEAIAAAVRDLIEDGPRRERLARAGRQSIIQNFDSRLGAATWYERTFGHPPESARSA
jgi:glycosyltransferase involved in cell wall biosynthesis